MRNCFLWMAVIAFANCQAFTHESAQEFVDDWCAFHVLCWNSDGKWPIDDFPGRFSEDHNVCWNGQCSKMLQALPRWESISQLVDKATVVCTLNKYGPHYVKLTSVWNLEGRLSSLGDMEEFVYFADDGTIVGHHMVRDGIQGEEFQRSVAQAMEKTEL